MRLKKINLFLSILFVGLSFLCFPLYAQDLVSPNDSREEAYRKAVLAYYFTPTEQLSTIKIYKSFLTFHNQYTPAQLDLVQVYQEEGKPVLALEFVENLISNGDDSSTYKSLAFLLGVQSGRYTYAESMEKYAAGDPELIFYHGFLRYQQGKYTEAITLFQQALLSKIPLPQAHHFLGMSYLAQKKYSLAIASFRSALKIEPNFLLSLEPMAQSYLAAGDWRRALATFNRAKSNLREKKSLQKSIDSITSKHASELGQEKQAKQERKTTVNVPVIGTFAKNPGQPVRVGISERMNSIFLKTGATYRLVLNGEVSAGQKGDIIHIYRHGQKHDDSIANKSYGLKQKDVLTIDYGKNAAATVVFDLTDGQGYFFVKTADRSYRGSIEVIAFPKGLTLINTVPLEEYLYSVVPSEIPSYWPMEALKAQAVAARTYTLVNLGQFAQRGFDLFGSIVSHAYTGISGETAPTTQAVNATAGLVLYTNQSKSALLPTYYSANTGGYTDPEGIVWNLTRPSLHVGRPDRKEPIRAQYLPPHKLTQWVKSRPATYSNWPNMHFPAAFRSVVWISAEEMAIRIGRTKKIGHIKGFEVLDRSISGRVTKVKALGESGSVVISGDLIRNRLGGLRSNLFVMQTITDPKDKAIYFVVYTAGWGHGIGMDQSGAAGMAANRYSYREILAHYYPRSVLTAYTPKEKS